MNYLEPPLWQGLAWPGAAGRGLARPGRAGQGEARKGFILFLNSGAARPGWARQGAARRGEEGVYWVLNSVRLGVARQGSAGHGMASKGFGLGFWTWRGEVGLGLAGRGKARQGKEGFPSVAEAGPGEARHGKAR